MWGEAVLGPLPDGFQGGLKCDKEDMSYLLGYINYKSGQFVSAGEARGCAKYRCLPVEGERYITILIQCFSMTGREES